MTEKSPIELMEANIREIRKQFEAMVAAHRPALWRYCHRLTGSAWDAEDLAQETLAKAFARLAYFWQPLEGKAYLFRIATNTWIDGHRRAKLPMDGLDAVPEAADPASNIEMGEMWGAMEALIQSLPPRQRVILLLTQVFDFTAGEVGAMIGLTEGAVKAAIHRARTTLKATTGAGQVAEARARLAAAPPSQLVGQYIAAFNRRDPEGIIALLDAEVTSDIVGAGLEHGLEYVRKYSLTDWAADPQAMWAEPGTLEGRQVAFVFYRTEQHAKALAWVITLGESEDRVTAITTYYFTPDLLQFAADELGVPACVHGYQYVSPNESGQP
jgi:RNA polymerase sigma factor (sigma-70 family)